MTRKNQAENPASRTRGSRDTGRAARKADKPVLKQRAQASTGANQNNARPKQSTEHPRSSERNAGDVPSQPGSPQRVRDLRKNGSKQRRPARRKVYAQSVRARQPP